MHKQGVGKMQCGDGGESWIAGASGEVMTWAHGEYNNTMAATGMDV